MLSLTPIVVERGTVIGGIACPPGTRVEVIDAIARVLIARGRARKADPLPPAAPARAGKGQS